MSSIDYFQDLSKYKLTIIFTKQNEIKDLSKQKSKFAR